MWLNWAWPPIDNGPCWVTVPSDSVAVTGFSVAIPVFVIVIWNVTGLPATTFCVVHSLVTVKSGLTGVQGSFAGLGMVMAPALAVCVTVPSDSVAVTGFSVAVPVFVIVIWNVTGLPATTFCVVHSLVTVKSGL